MLTSRLGLQGEKDTIEEKDGEESFVTMLASRLGSKGEKSDPYLTPEPEDTMFGKFKNWLTEDEEPRGQVCKDCNPHKLSFRAGNSDSVH